MHAFRKFVVLAVSAASLSLPVLAQHGDDHGRPENHGGYVKHAEWKKGGRIEKGDWGRGEQVDWKARHLHEPPHGYEWRQVDGNYVMAAVATGVIASAIVASSVH